jgi:hypothetical protein
VETSRGSMDSMGAVEPPLSNSTMDMSSAMVRSVPGSNLSRWNEE